MSYTGTTICARAAVDLNDAAQGSFTNAVLLPFLQEATRKIRSEYLANNLSYTRNAATAVTVAPSTIATVVTPSDLVLPIELLEAAVGASFDDYVRMLRVDYLPIRAAQTTLNTWSFERVGPDVYVPACTAARSLIIRYLQDMTVLSAIGDTINIPGAELYLQKKTAALASAYIGENYTRAQVLSNEADEELDKIIRMAVKNDQSLVVKRQPYRGTRWRLRQR